MNIEVVWLEPKATDLGSAKGKLVWAKDVEGNVFEAIYYGGTTFRWESKKVGIPIMYARVETAINNTIRDQSIDFNGEKYVDHLIVTTVVKVSLWGRIVNLVCPEIVFTHHVYIKDVVMPQHVAAPEIHSVSYWRKLRGWYLMKTQKGIGLVAESKDANNSKPKL